ncbi:putative pao retrotransposon peptidase superfamily [Trichonephila clavipes]|nr:putative pao retrotransposon peptidase superfamily [Trichonephila clavipes]
MEFENLGSEINYLKDIFVPRKYFENCNFDKDISLRTFCDSSESAYGAVAYFRSNCKTIYSDNASTFKSASKEIQYFFNIIKYEDFKNVISSEGVTWKFIVELAPWWGGFYERLMRSIKEPLRKIIGRAQHTFEETMTILAEIENVLNHRPLTYVSDDISDPEPLTPASFLLVGHKNEYPFNFSELLNSSTTRESLLKRKHYQTKLLSQFWKKWKTHYLLNIRSLHHFLKPSVERNLKVGVVIPERNAKSKFLWDLGRINKVMQGRDGLVRSCVIKTKKGEFKRPVRLVYLPLYSVKDELNIV